MPTWTSNGYLSTTRRHELLKSAGTDHMTSPLWLTLAMVSGRTSAAVLLSLTLPKSIYRGHTKRSLHYEHDNQRLQTLARCDAAFMGKVEV